MKRLVALACAAAFVFGSMAQEAQAIEIKAGMTWELGMGWDANAGFKSKKHGGEHSDKFLAAQRIRPQLNFIASETLEAVLQLEAGTTQWGYDGGQLDADKETFTIRRAHIDWTPVSPLMLRMGIQGLALPSATFGNPVLDADVAALTASYKFTDEISATVFWARPFDNAFGSDEDQVDGKNMNDEMDMFGIAIPMEFEGVSFTPWGMYARTGNDSGYWDYVGADADTLSGGQYSKFKGSSNMWWAGAAFELNILDPLSFKLDGMYGKSTASGDNAPEFAGWMVAGLIEFDTKTQWGKPGILGWYASGDDSDDYKDGKFGDYGRMPIVSNDRGGFGPMTYGFAGSTGCMNDAIVTNSGVGTWGLGLQVADMSFVDALSHTVRVSYFRGTNDKDMIRKYRKANDDFESDTFNFMGEGLYMTTGDHAWEADFLTSWEVQENLTVHFEASYIWMHRDHDTWGRDSDAENAWKANLLFEFAF